MKYPEITVRNKYITNFVEYFQTFFSVSSNIDHTQTGFFRQLVRTVQAKGASLYELRDSKFQLLGAVLELDEKFSFKVRSTEEFFVHTLANFYYQSTEG